MRLHTDFHDYYDHAVGYGIDDKVHDNRFTKEVEIRIKSQFDFPRNHHAGLLGFCGKIYPFIEFRKYNRKYDDEDDSRELKIIERYYAFDYHEFKEKEFDWRDFTSWRYSYIDHSREVKLRQFFTDWDYESDDIFLEHKAPIWTIKFDSHQNKGLINPKLKDSGFDRIKDAFTAFQDLSMYVANILVEQKETAVVEDKFRIQQHGFDLKKSFRKEKKK